MDVITHLCCGICRQVPVIERRGGRAGRTAGDAARTVLDVDCGRGLVGQKLTDHRYRVFGFDRAAAMLRFGSARRPGPLPRGNALGELPIRTGSLDAV
jgi:SAM-dependent methyltransferase